MSRDKKETYAIIVPKNDNAKKRMEYHGDKWIFSKEVENLKFVREKGPWLILISRDGKKCLYVKKIDDNDFDVRIV